ncbi:MAG: IS982 family transposase [Flavobacteriales bacterium]|nr:IS982 family transposase [Flavobacteriales bacterium]
MHSIDGQYLKGTKSLIYDPMHDLRTMYEKCLELTEQMYEDEIDELGNFDFYPNPPAFSDIGIIALSLMAESASIDSENLLFSILRSDYQKDFPNLPDRSRFNVRRRRHRERIEELCKRIGMCLGKQKTIIDLIDSVPIPVVKNSRERSYRICKQEEQTSPRKGYSAVDQRYFIGYKLHLMVDEHGVTNEMQILPANIHDITALKAYEPDFTQQGRTLIGDRGYISTQVQHDLFTIHDIELVVPYRRNQKDYTPFDPELGKKRRRIEVLFSQLCDQFKLKKNYAKTFAGLFTRIMSKLAAIAVLQWVNLEKGRPINQIRHAWS